MKRQTVERSFAKLAAHGVAIRVEVLGGIWHLTAIGTDCVYRSLRLGAAAQGLAAVVLCESKAEDRLLSVPSLASLTPKALDQGRKHS